MYENVVRDIPDNGVAALSFGGLPDPEHLDMQIAYPSTF